MSSRVLGAVLGAHVADAAAMPLHWIYDQGKLAELVQKVAHPEFYESSHCPFYTLSTGKVSGYQDEALVCLRAYHSAVKNGASSLTEDQFAKACVPHFGPDSPYAISFSKREQNYEAENKQGWKGAVEGPWLHRCMQHLLKNFEAGQRPTGFSESDEADGFIASIPIVALKSHEDDVVEQASVIVKSLTTSSLSLSRAAASTQILLAALKGEEDPVACAIETLQKSPEYEEVVKEMLQVKEDASSSPTESEFIGKVSEYGKACSNPGTFKGGVLAILTSSSYTEAVRKVIVSGGCNCSRANFVGAVMGALHPTGIPDDWKAKCNYAKEVEEMVLELSS